MLRILVFPSNTVKLDCLHDLDLQASKYRARLYFIWSFPFSVFFQHWLRSYTFPLVNPTTTIDWSLSYNDIAPLSRTTDPLFSFANFFVLHATINNNVRVVALAETGRNQLVRDLPECKRMDQVTLGATSFLNEHRL